MSLPKAVAGLTVIPVAYAHSTHVLYARAHVSRPHDVVFPEGRTLFVVNLPVDATDREIALFFKSCGMVERVVYDRNTSHDDDEKETEPEPEPKVDKDEDGDEDENEDKDEERSPSPNHTRKGKHTHKRHPTPTDRAPTIIPLPATPTRTLRRTGGIAHVVFLDASALAKALVPPVTPRPWPSEAEVPRGLAHYAALYDAQRPPLDVVRAHADSWMARFEWDAARATRTSVYRKGEAVVDDDGFTLVTRGGAYGKTLGGGVGVASKTFERTGRTGRKRKRALQEKATFYAFQKAEKQRTALLDLRKNFEADKVRIEKMRESRRFKPY